MALRGPGAGSRGMNIIVASGAADSWYLGGVIRYTVSLLVLKLHSDSAVGEV